MTRTLSTCIGALALFVLAGCEEKPEYWSGKHAGRTYFIDPSPMAQREVQELLNADKLVPGDVIQFGEGVYEFTAQLSLQDAGITVRGKGHDKTILSFKNQDQGSEGWMVKANNFVIEDLAVEDTKGDAIKVEGATNVTFRNVRVEWTGGPSEKNGAYGLYPVQCTNVLIEGCVAIGASDAGVYVGQSQHVIVRNNEARGNVAGIEIENTEYSEVYGNTATGNTGGLLVFDLPGLQRVNGGKCQVYDNMVVGNNHPNFAPKGNIVANVPPGTGMMIMAADHVHIHDNVLRDNETCNLSIVSFMITQPEKTDIFKNGFDPYSEGVYVHDNTFEGGGNDPAGRLGSLLKSALGTPVPDIVYDGVRDPAKLVDGELPEELCLRLENNGDADFVDLRLDGLDVGNLTKVMAKVLAKGGPSRDATPYQGSHPKLESVSFDANGGK